MSSDIWKEEAQAAKQEQPLDPVQVSDGQHSLECQKSAAEAKAAFEAWAAQYPKHCTRCYGWGGRSIPATRWEPPDFDLCSCLEEGRCPRCGEQYPSTEEVILVEAPCTKCGWNPNHAEGAPGEYLCFGDCLPQPEYDEDGPPKHHEGDEFCGGPYEFC